MREVVVDWCTEVCLTYNNESKTPAIKMQESFQLTHETLYLSVLLIDLYSSKRQVKKNEYQLIAAIAILIASKFYVSSIFK